MVFVLCLGFKAQAQNHEVVFLKEIQEKLPTVDKERLEYLIYSTPALLILDDEPVYVWNKDKNIETVDVNAEKLELLKNNQFADDFNSANLLILRFEENDKFLLNNVKFNLFNNLKYILIRYHNNISDDTVINTVSNLSLGNNLNNVIFLLEPNTGTDEEL